MIEDFEGSASRYLSLSDSGYRSVCISIWLRGSQTLNMSVTWGNG